MAVPILSPTPYPDVNAVLNDLLSSAREILGNNFLEMDLHGSLASGDFDAHWHALIEWALTHPLEQSANNLSETLELIRVAVERARFFRNKSFY